MINNVVLVSGVLHGLCSGDVGSCFFPEGLELGLLLSALAGPSSHPQRDQAVSNLSPVQPPDMSTGCLRARTLKPDGLGSNPNFATY